MLDGASGGECHPGEGVLCCPSAPGHMLFSFTCYNWVKPNVHMWSLFLIPFRGIACRRDWNNTNFHPVWLQTVFFGGRHWGQGMVLAKGGCGNAEKGILGSCCEVKPTEAPDVFNMKADFAEKEAQMVCFITNWCTLLYITPGRIGQFAFSPKVWSSYFVLKILFKISVLCAQV